MPTEDGDRKQILSWLIDKLVDILFVFSEKRVFDAIPQCYQLCLVAKTFVDHELAFNSFRLFGCLLLNLGYYKHACKMFYLARDLGYEIKNWSYVMQAFDYLGRVLQLDHDYESAMIAYKKMLQLAWLTNSFEYEIRAYSNLAKQNFYLQYPKKSAIYATRALNGLFEPNNSRSREIGIDMVLKQFGSFGKAEYMDKYERLGFEVTYEHPEGMDIKIIDCT